MRMKLCSPVELNHYALYNRNSFGYEDLHGFVFAEKVISMATDRLPGMYSVTFTIGKLEVLSGIWLTRVRDLTNDVDLDLDSLVTRRIKDGVCVNS